MAITTVLGGVVGGCSLHDLSYLENGGRDSTAKGGKGPKGGAGGADGGVDAGGDSSTSPADGGADSGANGGVGQVGAVSPSGGNTGLAGQSSAGDGGAGGDVAAGGSTQAGTSGSGNAAGNLIPNPSFEGTISRWVAFGSAKLQQSSDNCHSGTYCLRVMLRTLDWEGPAYNMLSLVTFGSRYHLSAWVRVSGVTPQNAALTVKTRCIGTDQALGDFNQIVTMPVSSNWVEFEGNVPIQTPADCAEGVAEVTMYVEGPEPSVDIFIDDVSLTLLP